MALMCCPLFRTVGSTSGPCDGERVAVQEIGAGHAAVVSGGLHRLTGGRADPIAADAKGQRRAAGFGAMVAARLPDGSEVQSTCVELTLPGSWTVVPSVSSTLPETLTRTQTSWSAISAPMKRQGEFDVSCRYTSRCRRRCIARGCGAMRPRG